MSIHNDIMNLRSNEGMYANKEQRIAYKRGHRDARHAAAEMCIRVEDERDQLAEALRVMLEASDDLAVNQDNR